MRLVEGLVVGQVEVLDGHADEAGAARTASSAEGRRGRTAAAPGGGIGWPLVSERVIRWATGWCWC